MSKFSSVVLASPMLFAAGCLVPFCIGPSVGYVPSARVDADTESVHAFRVVTSESSKFSNYGGVYCKESRQLTPIALATSGETKEQWHVSCMHAEFASLLLFWGIDWHRETVSVRLYRRGYDIVELKAWEFGRHVEWHRAETLAEQAKAIDDLVDGGSVPCHPWDSNKSVLNPGANEDGHRLSLLFAADEYARLAAALPPDDASANSQGTIWLEKAEQLRKRAAEKVDRSWRERFFDPAI